jgi:hypothetical protein
MPDPHDVKPDNWESIEVIYDDGDFSAISGKWKGRGRIGLRWNGDQSLLGFPESFGSPDWFIVPHFLTENVLLSLLRKLQGNKDPECEVYRDAVMGCLEKFFSRSFLK